MGTAWRLQLAGLKTNSEEEIAEVQVKDDESLN